jgi:chromosome segregation ATPase
VREVERRIEDWSAAHAARTRQVVEERLRLAGLFEEREAKAREGFEQSAEAEAAGGSALDALRAERETLADELARQRTDRARLEAGLERSREEIDGLRRALEAARREASEAQEEADRKFRRAETSLVDLRTEVERSTARLEKARSDQADVRLSQALLFAELAEARSDAGRFAEMRQTREGAVLRAEWERDLALAESARLASEIERLKAELDSLRAAAGRTLLRGLRGGRGA